MKRIDTPDGRFAAGDPTIRKPGTLVTSTWMNALQDEICNAIEGAGLTLDENDQTQLHAAIGSMVSEATQIKADIDSPTLTGTPTAPTPQVDDDSNRIATTAHVQAALLAQITASLARVCSIHDLPTSNIGPIIVAEASEVWIWVSTAYFTGYRSILCGRPVYGHTITPQANEIDAVGGLLSKTAYAGLWGYCRENGLVVSQSTWSSNIGGHWFVDVSPTQFRVPDLRNQFLRFTGTDADTANERVLGSRQADAFRTHTHRSQAVIGIAFSAVGGYVTAHGNIYAGSPANQFDLNWTGNSETRPANVAFHPRIHV